MKLSFLLVFLLVVNSLLAQDLVILHTNDLHSHILGHAPEAEYTPLIKDNDPTMGGFSRIAGFINSEKEKNADKLMVVDAGDFMMGTLFQSLETDNCFELNLMKKIGYDFVALGNHEFDFGPKALARMVSRSKANGEIPQLLCANFEKSKNVKEMAGLFDDGTILPYSIIQKNGYKIGVFGLMGSSANRIINSYHDVAFSNARKVAKKTAMYLKREVKVDLVIVLSHGGVEKDKNGNWVGEDIELGKASPDIDIIIGAHTHTYLPKAIKAGNAIIVQTGSYGSYVGKLEVTFNKERKPSVLYTLVPMDDKMDADAVIQQIIEDKYPTIEKGALKSLGVKFDEPIFETSFDLKMDRRDPLESNLGLLISDAIYNYLNKTLDQNVDFCMYATSAVRHNVEKGNTGKQNISDIFNLMPLGQGKDDIPGFSMGKIYINGRELKTILELMLAIYPSRSNYSISYGGLKIKYDQGKGLFRKIFEIEVGDEQKGFRKVSFSKKDKTLYCLGASTKVLNLTAKLRKKSFGMINVKPKNADGSVINDRNWLIDTDENKKGIQEAKEWFALYDFFSKMPDTNGNGIPDVPQHYKIMDNPIGVK
jgi:5'-nucleotidase / UDP-sugar diphosphatase